MAYAYRRKPFSFIRYENGVKFMTLPKVDYAQALDSALGIIDAARSQMLDNSLTGETEETLWLGAVRSTLSKLRAEQPNVPHKVTIRTKITR